MGLRNESHKIHTMSSQPAIAQELFQAAQVDYNTTTPVPPGLGITPDPGFSTEIQFVRTPTNVIINFPPIRGVVKGTALATGVISFGAVVPAAYQIPTYCDTPITIFNSSTPVVGNCRINISEIQFWLGIPTTHLFTVGDHVFISPISISYAASTVLEVTE